MCQMPCETEGHPDNEGDGIPLEGKRCSDPTQLPFKER